MAMMTYTDIAKRLKIPRGTLCRRVLEVNAKVPGAIKPDKVVKMGNMDKYLFRASRFASIKKTLESNHRPVGRPWPKKAVS